jgi:gluconate 2-dehydrogenase gamma chain
LENGDTDLGGVPAKVFFESLLSMTVEGYFSDPVYGGNKDMGAWKMIGFPGAYASFHSLVDQHGMLYTRPPISMGDDGRGVIHLHREEPAQPRKGGK